MFCDEKERVRGASVIRFTLALSITLTKGYRATFTPFFTTYAIRFQRPTCNVALYTSGVSRIIIGPKDPASTIVSRTGAVAVHTT